MHVNSFFRNTLEWPIQDDEDLLNGIREIFLLSKGKISTELNTSCESWHDIRKYKFEDKYSVEILFARYQLIWRSSISIEQLGASKGPITVYEKKGVRKFRLKRAWEDKDDQRLLNAVGKFSKWEAIAEKVRDFSATECEERFASWAMRWPDNVLRAIHHDHKVVVTSQLNYNVDLRKRKLPFKTRQEEDENKRRRIEDSDNHNPSPIIPSPEINGSESSDQEAKETILTAHDSVEKDANTIYGVKHIIDFYSSRSRDSLDPSQERAPQLNDGVDINSIVVETSYKEINQSTDEKKDVRIKVPKKGGNDHNYLIISDGEEEETYTLEVSNNNEGEVSEKGVCDDELSGISDSDDELSGISDDDSDVNDGDYDEIQGKEVSRSPKKSIKTKKQTISVKKKGKLAKDNWTNEEVENLLKAVRLHGYKWHTVRQLLKNRSIGALKTYFLNQLKDAFEQVPWDVYSKNENIRLTINREAGIITHEKLKGNESLVKLIYKGQRENPWSEKEDEILIRWHKNGKKLINLPSRLNHKHTYYRCCERVSALRKKGAL